MPYCTMAVSPCSTMMSSIGTPSSSAAICAKVVSSPCPCGDAPVMTVTLPVGSIFTVALSQPAAGVAGNTVGEHAHDVGGDVAEFIKARHHQDGKRGNRGREQLVIGTQILNQLEPQAQHGAVALGGHFVIVHVPAPVNRALEIF